MGQICREKKNTWEKKFEFEFELINQKRPIKSGECTLMVRNEIKVAFSYWRARLSLQNKLLVFWSELEVERASSAQVAPNWW